MAVKYVDPDAGGTASGDDWTNAYTDLQTALGAVAAGDTIYYAASTAIDTYATSQTISGPTVGGNPLHIVGVKDGTTATPPTNSDVAVRGTDTLPLFQVTGAGNDLSINGRITFSGVRLEAPDRYQPGSGTVLYFVGCELKGGGLFRYSHSELRLFNTEIISSSSSFAINTITSNVGFGYFEWIGGLLSGTAPTNLINTTSLVRIRGVDLSGAGTTIVTGANANSADIELSNCKMPASFTLFSDTPGQSFTATAIGCSSTTGKGSGASFLDFIRETREGTVETETTAVRTGGASDGADGSFSWAMTPNVDSTAESILSLMSPWMTVWIAGDGATSKTLTVYIANSGAADYNEDDAWLEVLTPDSGAGDAAHDLNTDDWFNNIIPGSTTAITDDADSTWGTGGNNPQKFSVTVTPDFEGVAYARVHFAKRFAASPETLYVDPKIEVT